MCHLLSNKNDVIVSVYCFLKLLTKYKLRAYGQINHIRIVAHCSELLAQVNVVDIIDPQGDG
jgi:hypothetical protein